jgi:TetR/AcrR family transcriptional regulator, transcriptional repressor for nem operon
VPAPPKTEKGRATRERIVATAAGLVREKGVRGTSLDDVIAAAGVSKSQVYHYFDDKADLMRAVVSHTRAELLAGQRPYLDRLDSWVAIEAWFDSMVGQQRALHAHGGCPIGSLVPELAEADDGARRELASSLDEWQRHLVEGLRAMRDNGKLSRRADPERLSIATMAALQGGLLLTQARRDPEQLQIALDAAFAHLRSFRPALGP